jgi:hypothetical protein
MGIHRPLLRIFVAESGVFRACPAALLARAVRGMLVLALALSGAGTVALAWPGHDGGGRVSAGAHQAGHPVSRGSLTALSPARGVPRPWIL